MKLDRPHFRQDLRHPSHDYRQAGCYFITVCTNDRQLLFGEVVDRRMVLNELGHKVEESWRELPGRFDGVSVDEPFVAMPNHFHGTIVISEGGSAPRRHLGAIVAAFKGATTRRIQVLRPGFVVWQSNYYEHVIRSEQERLRIGEYVLGNPACWDEDAHNPYRIGRDALEDHLREMGSKHRL